MTESAEAVPGVEAILFDVGGTLVKPAAPGTPVSALDARLLPGVGDALRVLARSHRLAAVTDTAVMDEAAVRKALAPIGIDALLEVVVTSTDVGAAKPDPRIVHEALRRLDVRAARALLVGDGTVDRDAARAAGIAFSATDAGLPDAIARARGLRSGALGIAIRNLGELDLEAREAALARHDTLTKPAGSLGRLEDLGAHLSAIARTCPPPVPRRPAVAVFAGDHGVVASGVTPWPQEITAQMVANFAAGGAAINVLARHAGASVHVVDVGVARDVSALRGVHDYKVRAGTADLARGPAMSTGEALAALDAGAHVAHSLVAHGHDLLVTGEMGIGNTTPAAALVAVLTATDPATVTGRGTGIDDAMLAAKIAVVERAAARAARHLDPVSVLAECGGLEIAALAGYCIAGAAARVPVVVDGVIACAALLVADAIAPGTAAACIAGHRSVEPGASVALAHLGLQPLLDLEMRLGEGTGACLAIPIVQASAAVLGEMATLDALGVNSA
ncbi:MAG TPA: nicotinate-nucleotide--dimethylbenzimidazole phosphoribosyltransferase [Acidimicrobiia bacterium]|nr:nicotinate-nucleotide--dimethylbenzimidazole phosphoribosyltransferase [Acidimicrobiia bacterium]